VSGERESDKEDIKNKFLVSWSFRNHSCRCSTTTTASTSIHHPCHHHHHHLRSLHQPRHITIVQAETSVPQAGSSNSNRVLAGRSSVYPYQPFSYTHIELAANQHSCGIVRPHPFVQTSKDNHHRTPTSARTSNRPTDQEINQAKKHDNHNPNRCKRHSRDAIVRVGKIPKVCKFVRGRVLCGRWDDAVTTVVRCKIVLAIFLVLAAPSMMPDAYPHGYCIIP